MAEAKKGKGSRRGREDWQRLLAKLDRSGLSVAAFCRREGVSAANLYRWRGVLGAVADAGETAASSTTSAFVDLGTLNPGPVARLELKLDLGDGLVLHLLRH
jgi:transposase-like protein